MIDASSLIGLCPVGIVLLACLVVIMKIISRLFGGSIIDCPECFGGERRPPGPCQTCGPKGKITVGSNPTPRGVGRMGISGRPGKLASRLPSNHVKGQTPPRIKIIR